MFNRRIETAGRTESACGKPAVIPCHIQIRCSEIVPEIKANYKISLTDSFALGLAKLNRAVVVSADHNEFDIVENAGELKFHWIR